MSKDNSVRVHHRNIQFLAIEMFKIKLGIAPTFTNDIFRIRDITNDGVSGKLRIPTEFYNYVNPKSVRYESKTLRSL